MKLYTKLQVEEIYLQGWYDGKIGFKDRIDDAISYQTPIELPSDDEIKEAVENKFGLVDPILGKSDYRMGYESGLIKGVKWMKKQTLNQNK